MSDIFDHEFDAYTQDMDGEYGGVCDWGMAPPDHNFYHTRVNFTNLKHETEKAYLFTFFDKVDVWVPKALCRELDEKAKTVLVHRPTVFPIMAKAVKAYKEKLQETA